MHIKLTDFIGWLIGWLSLDGRGSRVDVGKCGLIWIRSFDMFTIEDLWSREKLESSPWCGMASWLDEVGWVERELGYLLAAPAPGSARNVRREDITGK